MKRESFKQRTLDLTGWSEQEYRRQYRSFSKAARNYNLITGRHTSAAEQLYYRERYPDTQSNILKGIAATPKTQARRAGETIKFDPATSIKTAETEDITRNDILNRWGGFIAYCESRIEAGYFREIPKDPRITYPDYDAVVDAADALRVAAVSPVEAETVFKQNAERQAQFRADAKKYDPTQIGSS